jgi:transcriptional regulator GlxA family with amidase domain
MKIVAQRRIEAAQTLLRNTNLPIREIGGYVGFGHLSHFSRQFTQIARITPSQYRKTHRAETSTGPKTKPSRKID